MSKYIYITIGLVLLILGSIYLGKSIGQKDQKDTQTKEKIKIIQIDNKETIKKIDSLSGIIKSLNINTKIIKEKEVLIREKAKDIPIEKPINTSVCDELFENSTKKIALLEETLTLKDSIETNLNSVITNQETIILNKDRIISNKDKELELTKELNKGRNKKYTIGLGIGYGYGVISENNKVVLKNMPYVGVTISRTIFNF